MMLKNKPKWAAVLTGIALVLTANLVVARPTAEKDIVDTAVASGSFKTLAAAPQAAGLVDTLKDKGPFTVFARGRSS